jgi:predicted extracellular nuclease
MTKRTLLNLLVIVALVLGVVPLAVPARVAQAAGAVGLAAFGSAYTQDFDTLASSGTSSVVPTGWEFSESGTNANTTYTAGTGSSNTGDTYSFGLSPIADRAFGGLLSGSLVPAIGAMFANNTGGTITQLAIAYTGEQWRLGATGRTDRLDFQYSIDASSLTSGVWTDVDELDFNGPISAGAVGALDGNAAANRVAISFTITGLNIPNGATFWIRWLDFNASGADDGLAVDDFSLTPQGTVIVANPKINEFSASTVGTDVEYVEIYGDPNTDYSAYTVLEIEGDSGAAAGTVDEVISLGTTGANGLYLVNLPANALENGTLTFVLVKNFSGALNADLDTNNDGVFDVTPWDSIVDAVAVNDGGAGDLTYGTPTLGVAYDGLSFAPGGASRIPDGFDTDSATDWVRNDFDLAGIPGFDGTPIVGEAYNTPGAPNQVVTPPAPQLVINEVDYDQPSSDTAEFIEIKNNGSFAVSLDGWTLELVNGNAGGAVIYKTIALPTVSLAAGNYFVVCANAGTVVNCDLDVTPDTDLIQNGAPDAIGLRYNGDLMDAVSYEGDTGAPYTEGSGAGLTDTAVGAQSISRCPDGADTNVNNIDFVLVGITPGAANACVDAAPAVASTFPLAGATDFPVNGDLTVTFSEPVNVTGVWFNLSCSVSGSVSAVVSGGPAAFTLNPDSDLIAGETCTLTVFAADVTDQDVDDPPDNMEADFTLSFSTLNVCALPYTPIYTIQGSGLFTPIPGAVTTQGVVVGDYEGPSPALRGFYIQDMTGDGDTATSDGIFVFNGNNNNVNLGDVVRVSGTAAEFQDQTQVSASSIVKCGAGTVEPTEVTFPVPSATYLEQFEGMLVRLPQTMYVTEHFQLGRFGQVVLSSGGRLKQPTNVVAPGAPALALQAQNNLNKIILDDDLQNQNPDPILFGRGGLPLSASNTLRGGDTATGVVGLMTYTWSGNAASGNAYRLRPINALGGGVPNFQPANPRPISVPEVGGTVRVVGMNLLNFFNTFSGCTAGVGGVPTDCRGANSAAEFARQYPKTVAAILAMNPDVLGVNELENDGYGSTSSIQFLVDQLNAATAPGTYAFIDVDANTGQVNAMGTDAIRVALLYQPGVVTPVGQTSALNTTAFINGGDSAPRNRASLAQAFQVNDTGAVFIVNVNHLKSKGSACDLPDQGDGQGNCNQVRLNAVNELMNWFATDPTGTGDPDIVLVGDYNSYAMEDPIIALENGGFTHLIKTFLGPDAYSYVFDGQWGYLDHALGSASVTPQVTGVGDYHINADEPSVLDYNTEFKSAGQIASLYAPDQFRVSDHDPVVIGLNPNAPPTVNAGGPYSVDEGGSVTLNATGSDPNGDTLAYEWDLDNNGSFEASGQSVAFSAASLDGPSSYTVKVKATDPGGLFAVDSATVSVVNVAPIVNTPTVTPEPSTEGSGVTASATFSDPAGNLDAPFTCTVNYGDGSGMLLGIVNGGTCTGPTHTYSTFGSYTVTVNVTDKDGDTGSGSTTHMVIFNWAGFFQPIDNLPVVNSVKAGQAIPVKFSLGGYKGLNIFVTGYPLSQRISCNTSAPLADIEETLTAGNSSLSYSAGDDRYNYVWKTEKSWAGQCRQLVVKLVDGTYHYANFKFK